MKEGVIPTDHVTDLTIGIFLALVFHDSGITLQNSYDQHEAGSIKIVATFLNKLEQSGRIPADRINTIWMAVMGIYGTKILFEEGRLFSMSEKDSITFRNTMLQDLSTVADRELYNREFGTLQAGVLQAKIMKIFSSKEVYETIRTLGFIFCTADTMGVLAENSTLGTIAVAKEVVSLHRIKPTDALIPRFISVDWQA